MNSAEISSLYKNIDKLIFENSFKDRSVVVFGANKPSEVTISYLSEKNIAVDAVIDNDLNKNGKKILDVEIHTPEQLLGEIKHKPIVLIASQYFDDMCLQLSRYGLEKDKDIFKTITYKNYTTSFTAFEDNVKAVMEGFEYYNDLKNSFGEDVFIFLNPYGGLGDAYVICRYLEAHVKKNNIQNYILTAVGKGALQVYSMFDITVSHKLSQQQTDALVCYSTFSGEKNIKVLQPVYVHTDIMANAERSRLISWGKIYSEVLLGLDENAKVSLPKINRGNAQNILKNMPLGKTVILAPYANTMQSVAMEAWEALAQVLLENGFEVVTNCAALYEKPVSGTQRIDFPLTDAIDVCENAGAIIGLRSGFCDLISTADCKKVILYPSEQSLWFFGMNDMGLCQDAYEIVYDGEPLRLAQSVLEAVGLFPKIH